MTKFQKSEHLLSAGSTLNELKLQIVAMRIRKLLEKYRSDQPRVPAGVPEGGQWVGENGSGRLKFAGKWDLLREPLCLEQLQLDEELCRVSGSAKCWSLTQTRFAACMKDEYVPILRH